MGDTITVQYRIDNTGTDYSGSFYWKLYLSTDSSISTSDVYVDEFSVSSISGGSYRSGYEYSVTIPTGINSGYYYLGMIADNRGTVNELDETNNVVSSSSRIDIEEPADLIPDSPSGQARGKPDNRSASLGESITPGMTPRLVFWEMYISTDSTITTSDTKLGSTQQASSISGGSYRSGTFSASLPSNLAQGTYYFGIIVDSTSRISEGDEPTISRLEIRFTSPFQIMISKPPQSLLDSGYRQVCEGSDIYITLSVTNLGSDNAGSHYYEALSFWKFSLCNLHWNFTWLCEWNRNLSPHTLTRACWRHCQPVSHLEPTMSDSTSIMATTFPSPMKTTTLLHQTVLN